MLVCSGGSFFFFKQKTAYEMRISDWSSDVCSSDLLHLAPQLERYLIELVLASRDAARYDPALARRISRSEERRVGKECVSSVDLGGRRIIKKKNKNKQQHVELMRMHRYRQRIPVRVHTDKYNTYDARTQERK